MSDQLALRCGYCERKLRIPSVLAGRKGMCPKCNVRFMVPTPADVLAALPERFVCMPVGTPPPMARSKADLRESSADDTIEIPSLNALRGDPDVDRLLDAIESSKRGDFEPAPAPRRQSLDDLLDGPQVVYDGAAPSRSPPTPQPALRTAKGPVAPARPASAPLPVVKPTAPLGASRPASATTTPRPQTQTPPPRPAPPPPPAPKSTSVAAPTPPPRAPSPPPTHVHAAAASPGDESVIAEPSWVFEPGAAGSAPERLLDLNPQAIEAEEPLKSLDLAGADPLDLDSPPLPQPAVVFAADEAVEVAPESPSTRAPLEALPGDNEPRPAEGLSSLAVPACGFEIRSGHILVAHTPKLPWFREQLLGMLLALDARPNAPGVLDLSHADRVDSPMLRRAAMAILYAEMSGKPIKLHVTENQMPLVRDLGLDRLIPYSSAPRGGIFDRDTGTFSKSHVDDLLQQSKSDVLPATVVNQQFEEFGRGSYTTRLRSVERKLPPGMAAEAPAPEAALPPPVYTGPDRRTEDRFAVEDAEIVVRVGDESLAASLEDLSVKGARLTTRRRLTAGDVLELSISVTHVVNSFAVEARAVWCEPANDAAIHDSAELHRIAVFFTSVPGASMIKLRRLEGKFLQ